jgi:hypothetical protein
VKKKLYLKTGLQPSNVAISLARGLATLKRCNLSPPLSTRTAASNRYAAGLRHRGKKNSAAEGGGGGLVAGPVSAREARGLHSRGALSAKQHVACKTVRGAAVGTKQHVACRTVAGPLSAQSSTWPAEQSRGRCRHKAARGLQNSRGAAVGTKQHVGWRQSRARGAVVPAVPEKKKSRLLT